MSSLASHLPHILLPAALGDASLANLPPEAGLYACLFGGLVFWIFCGSRYTAASQLLLQFRSLSARRLARLPAAILTRFGALAAGTALLVSLIAFVAWLAKAGVLVHFISESVMTGFKCGVALFLASTQLPKLFGFHGAHGSFWANTGFFFEHLNETNTTSLLVGGIALALLILGKIFLKHKPVALFVVIGGIIAASAFSLETRGVKLIGAVPQGIPPLKVPALSWRDLNQLASTGVGLLSSRRGRNGRDRPNVRREARRTIRCQSGKSGARCVEPVRRTRWRLSSKRRHIAVARQ